MDDEMFRRLRQAGFSRPAVEALDEILNELKARIAELEAKAGTTPAQ